MAQAFPTAGVSLSVMKRLAVELGPQGTTTDLCMKIALEKTKEKKCSLVDYLKETSPEDVGEATHFVSHAWSYLFSDVVDALEEAIHTLSTDDGRIFFWFDAICVNQNVSLAYTQEWWSTTFLQAIRKFNNTLFVMLPWSDPRPLKRAWCLWEILSTLIVKARFKVILPKREQASLEAAVQTRGALDIVKAFSLIDAAKADAFKQSDREMIFSAIRAMKGGFAQLNTEVTTAMREWLERTLREALERYNVEDAGTESERTITFMEHFAWVLEQHGKFAEADKYYRHALRWNESHASDDRIATSKINLTSLLSAQGRFEEAAELLESEETRYSQLPNPNQLLVVSMLQSIGSIHGRTNRYDEALRCYIAALFILQRTPDQANEDIQAQCLALQSNMGTSMVEMGDLKEGFSLLREVIQKRTELLGESHADTLRSRVVMASKMFDTPFISKTEHEEAMRNCHLAYLGYCKIHGPNSQLALLALQQRAKGLALITDFADAKRDYLDSLLGFRFGLNLTMNEILPNMDQAVALCGPEAKSLLDEYLARAPLSAEESQDPEVIASLSAFQGIAILNASSSATTFDEKESKRKQALEQFEFGLRQEQVPESVSARIRLNRLFALDSLDESISEAEKLEQSEHLSMIAKTRAITHCLKGLMESKQYGPCIEFVERLLKKDNDAAILLGKDGKFTLLSYLGEAYLCTESYESAKQTFELVMTGADDKSPAYSRALLPYGQTLARLQDPKWEDVFTQACQRQWARGIDAVNEINAYLVEFQRRSGQGFDWKAFVARAMQKLNVTSTKQRLDLVFTLYYKGNNGVESSMPFSEYFQMVEVPITSTLAEEVYDASAYMTALNASQLLESAIKLWKVSQPTNALGVYKNASAYWRLQRYEEACGYLKSAIDLIASTTNDEGIHGPAIMMLIQASMALKHYVDVHDLVTKIKSVSKYPDLDRETRFDLEFFDTKSLMLTGRFEEAVVCIKSCKELAPDPTKKLQVEDTEALIIKVMQEQQKTVNPNDPAPNSAGGNMDASPSAAATSEAATANNYSISASVAVPEPMKRRQKARCSIM